MAKIIVADDTESALVILKTVLESKGHDVYTFRNGQEVLDNFSKIEPDAVLLDVQMPVLSGIETCVELRKRPESYNTPIAMISGHDAEEEIVNGLTSGADLYILKPIHADEVISKLSLLLNKRGHSSGAEMAENVVFASYFKIIRLLGTGGYSSVYLAKDTRNANPVALKILDTHQATKRYVSQFLREAYGLSRLNHPNIVKLVHFGNFGNKYYLVTEFIEGESLDQIVQENPISENYALEIAEKMCDALKYLSSHSIIHRDLKPGNILISPEGRIVLVDFGLAREENQNTLSLDGEMQGTPHILSPEYIKDESLTYKVDVYSLGVTLFHAVSGRYPFESNDPIAVIQSHLDKTPPRLRDISPDVSETFSYMIERMLVKNPHKRCSLQEFTELIRKCRKNEKVKPGEHHKTAFQSPEFDYHSLPVPGKFSTITSKVIESYHDLSFAIAQGSKNICLEICEKPEKIWDYGSKSNLVAIISDGSTIYDITPSSPEATIPALEGYASVIKKFGNIDAIPLPLNIAPSSSGSKPEQILKLLEQITPSFGGFLISCCQPSTAFQLAEAATTKLEVPIYNERYDSMAIAVIGNLIHATNVLGKSLDSCKIVFNQINGYSKSLLTLLKHFDCQETYLAKQAGCTKLDEITISELEQQDQKLPEIIEKGYDILLDFTGNTSWLTHAIPYMPEQAIIISLSPHKIDTIFPEGKVFIPLDISFPELLTSLITPGILRGTMDVQAKTIDNDMKLAAATTFATLVSEKNSKVSVKLSNHDESITTQSLIHLENTPEAKNIIQPNIFQVELVTDIATSVAKAAMKNGLARKPIDDISYYAARIEERLLENS